MTAKHFNVIKQSLTNEQQFLIANKLPEYDVDNLTPAYALSIVDAFSVAGIEQGVAVEKRFLRSVLMLKRLAGLRIVQSK
ncbi:MAG: hypothetical protein ACJAV1_000576 [Paraglaciecola sp.]